MLIHFVLIREGRECSFKFNKIQKPKEKGKGKIRHNEEKRKIKSYVMVMMM